MHTTTLIPAKRDPVVSLLNPASSARGSSGEKSPRLGGWMLMKQFKQMIVYLCILRRIPHAIDTLKGNVLGD